MSAFLTLCPENLLGTTRAVILRLRRVCLLYTGPEGKTWSDKSCLTSSHRKHVIRIRVAGVVDPNSLYVDPDPEICTNLDPDPQDWQGLIPPSPPVEAWWFMYY